MTSQSFFDRLTSSRRPSLLPFHSSPQRGPSEYDLDELEPRPEDRLLNHSPPLRQYQGRELDNRALQSPPELWDERASSVGSASKFKESRGRLPKAMFAGPPPPIVASVVLKTSEPNSRHSESAHALIGQNPPAGSVLFDHRAGYSQAHLDSTWRLLRRQEKAIEQDVQTLLDLQASGLIAGLGGRPPTGSDLDDRSDAGSSTPTGTFYSTATSKSRMMNSLHIPTRANVHGEVIPVRQPKRAKPPGLRAARIGLRKTMLALASLKVEEDAHIDNALEQRKKALLQLDRLSSQRDRVNNQLHVLEDNDEEPLSLALRDLSVQYHSLTQEIHALEEKLVGMRNRRRVVRAQMDDVKNQREAGLSGFKGALRDIENDIAAMMRRPPIQPLDLEIFDQVNPGNGSEDQQINMSGGMNFLRLIPERRTVEMARSWWQTEITALERRKAQIDGEQRALEEGGVLWLEVMALVTDFESRLRIALRATSGESSAAPESDSSRKGKEKIPAQEDVIREQLPLLKESISALEGHLHTAESSGWNLLICAIGAELEAFREAHGLLQAALEDDERDSQDLAVDGIAPQQQESDRGNHEARAAEDSDENEVPDDLLVPRSDIERPQADFQMEYEQDFGKGSVLRRVDSSDNDVPADFVAQHDKLD